jgi:hypothetical protein
MKSTDNTIENITGLAIVATARSKQPHVIYKFKGVYRYEMKYRRKDNYEREVIYENNKVLVKNLQGKIIKEVSTIKKTKEKEPEIKEEKPKDTSTKKENKSQNNKDKQKL